MLKDVPLDQIRTDGGTQPRAALNDGIVALYSETPEQLPPGDAVFDGSHFWLWDGFHRYFGLRKAGSPTMALNVTEGTVEDARWLSCGANKHHPATALRMTSEDKRNAIRKALAVKPDASDRAISDHVGVSHSTVAAVRSSLAKLASEKPTRTYTTRHGTPAVMNTAGIGESNRSRVAGLAPKPERPAVLCDRCRRGALVVGCERCARLNGEWPEETTEPGPEGVSPPAQEPATDGSTFEDRRDAVLQEMKDIQDEYGSERKLPPTSYVAAVKGVKFWLAGNEFKGFVPPTLEEVKAYIADRKSPVDPEAFCAFYEANGWKQANGQPLKDWKPAVITWEKNEAKRTHGNGRNQQRARPRTDMRTRAPEGGPGCVEESSEEFGL